MQEIEQLPSAAWQLRRGTDTHKGMFGAVAVLGGARGMTGAALLAARATLLLGAGKVWVGLLDANISVDFQYPELMLCTAEQVFTPLQATHLLAGMGMGTSAQAVQILGQCLASELPLLLDADALNLIAAHLTLQQQLSQRPAPTLLTPHPSEAARLLGISTATVQQDRTAAARALAERYQCHIVLKGHGTLVMSTDGQLSRNHSGNAALSSAGQGDTLAGMIMSVCAQGLELASAARVAVFLHGQAADNWLDTHPAGLGLSASETIYLARSALNHGLAQAELTCHKTATQQADK